MNICWYLINTHSYQGKKMHFGYIIPKPKTPDNDHEYLEVLAKNIFRMGFNWIVVEERWPEIRKAFDEFRVEKVAGYTESDVMRLLDDKRMIRHRKKIEAIISNATLVRAIANQFGSFKEYLKSFRDEPYHRRRDRIALSFRNLGKTGAFCFLYTINEEVPKWEERLSEL
ncbi:MAG: hypothetical protein A3A65_00250 [Candidatus Chisholmbacteria bacterium RIFCSPLOWO2_01_FULL_49_14]|uniref:DNA-3-methyladenine glycosylase n=1 Tax=Candidatus Chisholmbacteria bacterium RIFCSPLOWO2_01_FULL_49_14 TaxID=1797593 RepID=A0A1G1W186_9BACT|nr:MAG: hypothetical protein A3A65_00250 [Candidatus Chisholmbacteria bacterium RIFCSPLOWO2_01_FULL_49_14]